MTSSRHAEPIILRGRWVVLFIHFAFAWRRFYSTNLLAQVLLFILAVLRWKEHFLVALRCPLWIYRRHVSRRNICSCDPVKIYVLALFRIISPIPFSLCHSPLPLVSGKLIARTMCIRIWTLVASTKVNEQYRRSVSTFLRLFRFGASYVRGDRTWRRIGVLV